MVALDVAADAAVAPHRRRLSYVFWPAAGWIGIVVLAASLANFLPIPSPTEMDMLARRMAPDAQHWLGTDGLGRDMLSRLVFGARTSLTAGLLAPMIGLLAGGGPGILAGDFAGKLQAPGLGGMARVLGFAPLGRVL